MRTFVWWFGMGSMLTLSVLMVQGGVRDLLYGTPDSTPVEVFLSIGSTIFGGGILAGCLAVILNRLR
ncbi:MAG: hypothetical protein O3A59_15320 [Nitrospirae bacterium]|nr:hypothetical protein [Nitrospirota bacterium]